MMVCCNLNHIQITADSQSPPIAEPLTSRRIYSVPSQWPLILPSETSSTTQSHRQSSGMMLEQKNWNIIETLTQRRSLWMDMMTTSLWPRREMNAFLLCKDHIQWSTYWFVWSFCVWPGYEDPARYLDTATGGSVHEFLGGRLGG